MRGSSCTTVYFALDVATSRRGRHSFICQQQQAEQGNKRTNEEERPHSSSSDQQQIVAFPAHRTWIQSPTNSARMVGVAAALPDCIVIHWVRLKTHTLTPGPSASRSCRHTPGTSPAVRRASPARSQRTGNRRRGRHAQTNSVSCALSHWSHMRRDMSGGGRTGQGGAHVKSWRNGAADEAVVEVGARLRRRVALRRVRSEPAASGNHVLRKTQRTAAAHQPECRCLRGMQTASAQRSSVRRACGFCPPRISGPRVVLTSDPSSAISTTARKQKVSAFCQGKTALGRAQTGASTDSGPAACRLAPRTCEWPPHVVVPELRRANPVQAADGTRGARERCQAGGTNART